MNDDPIIIGSTIRTLDCGKRTHGLEDRSVMIGLVDQLIGEFPHNSWYATVVFANGRITQRGHRTMTRAPAPDVCHRMVECGVMLNRELHHGGCWIVVWHDNRMSFMWRDADGDAAFVQQINEPWIRIKAWADTEFTDRAELAWHQFREQIKMMALKPEHMMLLAKRQGLSAAWH